MLQTRKVLARGLALSLVGLAVTACGNDGGSSSDESSSETSAAAGEIAQETIDVGLEFTGGEAGAADTSLPPVKIGFVNQQGGTPGWPEYEGATDAAVKFVNEHLGGIDGHPVELVKCVVQSEEDGQKCGAELLADPDIHIAHLGTSVVGNATFYKTIDGKFPVFVGGAGGVADSTTPHVYELDGGSAAVLSAFTKAASDLDAKDVAVVSTGNAGGKYVAGQVLDPQMTEAGITPKVAYVSDTAAAPEYTSAMQAAGASTADAIVLIASGPDMCVNFYNSLQQLGATAPVLTAYGCYGDPVPEATGGGPEGWTFFGLAQNQRATDSAEATAFRTVMEWAGEGKSINLSATPMSFASIFAIAKIGNELGFDGLSGEAFEQGIQDLEGPAFMVPGDINCGSYPDPTQVGICGDSASVSTYNGTDWEIGEPVQAVQFP
jgi:branched-chain amino acid transport system substrate-binding protein